MPLTPIKTRKKPEPFSVFDIETTTDLKRVYLVGWYDGLQYRYWESSPLPPENPLSAISLFLGWYFSKPRKGNIYAHNGGNFDTVFALAEIIANRPEFQIEIIPSQSAILQLKLKKRAGRDTWVFLDSARLLPDSLDNLGACFVGRRKIEVDDYETLHLNPLRYEYLKNDCVLLYDVLSRYFDMLRDKIGGQPGISAASTALATYRLRFQRQTLPDISERAASLARAGYYGGRCEPFRREFNGSSPAAEWANDVCGRNRGNGLVARPGVLHDYDVNSMYPWAMKQPQPTEELDLRGSHLELSGFIEATVTVKKCHIPILPCRAEGKLLFPYGRWRGVFSTAELRLAEEYGQLESLRVHDSVYFKTADIFGDYVDTLYAYRDKNRPDWLLSLDRVAKINLNTLYGKFGSTEVRESIHIRPTLRDVVEKGLEHFPATTTVDAFIERSTRHAAYMLPQISAWITSLGRCRIAPALIEAGQGAYYCDTDALFTPNTISGIGTELGEWKDEYSKDPIVYAYFLGPKVYVLRHASGAVTNKAKGFAQFGKKLPANAVEILTSGKSLEVSRFAKARSVLRGDFGLIIAQKRCRQTYEKRLFHDDGSSEPRKVEL